MKIIRFFLSTICLFLLSSQASAYHIDYFETPYHSRHWDVSDYFANIDGTYTVGNYGNYGPSGTFFTIAADDGESISGKVAVKETFFFDLSVYEQSCFNLERYPSYTYSLDWPNVPPLIVLDLEIGTKYSTIAWGPTSQHIYPVFTDHPNLINPTKIGRAIVRIQQEWWTEFEIVPVPEPSFFLLIAIGLGTVLRKIKTKTY